MNVLGCDGRVRDGLTERAALRWALAVVATIAWLAACGGGTEHAPFYSPLGPDAERDAGGHPQRGSDAGDSIPSVMKPMGCADGPELHVLFIGNSHTRVNDLPMLVQQLACDAGTKVVTQSALQDGVGFVEHAMNPDVLAAIAADAWDFVVMQDQQQRPGWRLPQVDRDYVPALRTLVDAIVKNRARTRRLLYMVWARRPGDIDVCDTYPILCTFEGNTLAVAEGYRLYAERTDSEVASVALAWAVVRADPDAPLAPESLWADDGSHAALPGSYLAAAVLVAQMLDVTTKDFVFSAGLEEPVTSYLRRAADRIVTADRKDPRVQTSEHVAISCDDPAVCTNTAHGAAVTWTLSHDTCADIRAGRATIAGRIHTRMGVLDGLYSVVPLGGWHEVSGAKIADGAYRVHAYVDIDDNGKLGKGDLDACADFQIGSGEDLVLSKLAVR